MSVDDEVPNGSVRHLLHGRLGASGHVHVAYSRGAYDQGFILNFIFFIPYFMFQIKEGLRI